MDKSLAIFFIFPSSRRRSGFVIFPAKGGVVIEFKSERNDFCRVVDQYLSILIKLSKKARPQLNEEIIKERIDFQKNYCVQQMKNEKTSMVLLKYFDEKWVNNYIKTVLFDF